MSVRPVQPEDWAMPLESVREAERAVVDLSLAVGRDAPVFEIPHGHMFCENPGRRDARSVLEGLAQGNCEPARFERDCLLLANGIVQSLFALVRGGTVRHEKVHDFETRQLPRALVFLHEQCRGGGGGRDYDLARSRRVRDAVHNLYEDRVRGQAPRRPNNTALLFVAAVLDRVVTRQQAARLPPVAKIETREQ